MTAAAEASLRAERVADLHRIAEEDIAWVSSVRAEVQRRAARAREALALAKQSGVGNGVHPDNLLDATAGDLQALATVARGAARVSL